MFQISMPADISSAFHAPGLRPWSASQQAAAPAPAPHGSSERELSHWLTCMLDEIDYGMLLVDTSTRVVYVNQAARHELDGQHPLQLQDGVLRTREVDDLMLLLDALAAARRGLRRLLLLGQGSLRVSVSVVPLEGEGARGNTTLLVLGKRQVCDQQTVQGYARGAGLTPAETRVLEQLCAGVRPTEVAQRQGVAVSTVRSQIGSIRTKTGAQSIHELVRQVAVLPPMARVLRPEQGGA